MPSQESLKIELAKRISIKDQGGLGVDFRQSISDCPRGSLLIIMRIQDFGIPLRAITEVVANHFGHVTNAHYESADSLIRQVFEDPLKKWLPLHLRQSLRPVGN